MAKRTTKESDRIIDKDNLSALIEMAVAFTRIAANNPEMPLERVKEFIAQIDAGKKVLEP